MYYSGIEWCDPANGIGIRVTIFVSGCTHNCLNCHNPTTHNFTNGEPWTDKELDNLRDYFNTHSYIKGLTISGGDPLNPLNLQAVSEIVRVGYECNRNIWVYTGYTFEQLEEMYKENEHWLYIRNHIDVLVDGEFINHLKDLRLRFRGSSNQRLIDVPLTLQSNQIMLWKN